VIARKFDFVGTVLAITRYIAKAVFWYSAWPGAHLGRVEITLPAEVAHFEAAALDKDHLVKRTHHHAQHFITLVLRQIRILRFDPGGDLADLFGGELLTFRQVGRAAGSRCGAAYNQGKC